MALLAIAAAWARARGVELCTITVDHGLRPASAGEAAFVADFAARIGVEHRALRAGAMQPGNLSAAAREARYSLMAEWARAEGVAAIALGHTMDDQAETLLLRLARGSGVDGLAAMAARRDWRGVGWIRPMLSTRRDALRAWLRAEGIPWIDDPTNEDPAFDRVKARHALGALHPLGITVEGLARTSAILARQRRVLERAAEELAASALRHGEFGEIRLSHPALAKAEYDTLFRVFGQALAKAAGQDHPPRARVLEPAILRLFGLSGDESQVTETDGGQGVAKVDRPSALTLGGCLVLPGSEVGETLICREPAAAAPPLALDEGCVIWDGRWQVLAPSLPEGRWSIGALGASGCTHLRRLAEKGEWHPPATWASAPAPVRETVAAIFPVDDPAPVAVPAIGYIAPDAPPELGEVRAELLRRPVG